MRAYLIRRLLLIIPTLLGITLVTFMIIRLAPGEPAALGGSAMAAGGGTGRQATPASAELLRAKKELLGLDKPIYMQYLTWVGRMATLDFGDSWSNSRPVTRVILDHISPTLQINLLAVLLIYGISIPLGVGQAVRRGRLFDRATTLITFLLYAAPVYWLGPILLIYFCNPEHWQWFPSGEMNRPFPEQLAYFPWLKDRLYHLVLPVICESYAGLAYLSKQARAGLLENLQADYVRTARAKGVSGYRAVVHHALRNSLIPVVTIMAMILPGLIGGSIIVENIFSIQGMGYLSFSAILQRDYPVIMATATFAAVLTLIGMLLQDILYAWLDPRVSYG
jgi:peptide/nickel transport system permease protein